jgi:hypothetical protein
VSCTAAWNQVAFRGRNDDGSETLATWKATQNSNWSQAVDTNFRVRFEVQETAGCAKNNVTPVVQCNKNGAGWFLVNGIGAAVVSALSTHYANDDDCTDQLTVGTGTFQGGDGMTEGTQTGGGAAMDVAASGHYEVEFCLSILSGEVVNGDTIQLRATDAAAAFAAYDAIPTVTVIEAAAVLPPRATVVNAALTRAFSY